jgi:hypothetical protein
MPSIRGFAAKRECYADNVGVLQALLNGEFEETVIDIGKDFAKGVRLLYIILQAHEGGTIYLVARDVRKLHVLRISDGGASSNQLKMNSFNEHFSINGDWLAALLKTGEVVVMDTRTGDEVTKIRLNELRKPDQEGLVAVTDSHLFYCGLEDEDGEPVAHFQTYDLATGTMFAAYKWHCDNVEDLSDVDMAAEGGRVIVLLTRDVFLLQACHYHSIF